MQSSPLKPQRRFTERKLIRRPQILVDDHPAAVEGRTLFPTRVTDSDEQLLKSGKHSRKLGSHVVKGRWAGFPIFTLTLEERKTCPRSCQHWQDCYGNNMQFAPRHAHGPEMEQKLRYELFVLQQENPKGFVVRLHVLGDFYSSDYVVNWGNWLNEFPALHVFGYTARNPHEDDIGLALLCLRHTFPNRWWVRFSDKDNQTWLSTGATGIVCPVQTGKTECCGTCALCWTVEKPIRFLPH